jgi:hypothetical protein
MRVMARQAGRRPPASGRVLLPTLAAVGGLIGAVAAEGAASSVHLTGRTSQRRAISLTLTAGSITQLQYRIVDRCPGGRLLFVHDWGFPALPVKDSKFGGTFAAKPPQKATAIVSGTVSGRTVRGSLSDRTRNRRTHKFCTGKATFKLTERRR